MANNKNDNSLKFPEGEPALMCSVMKEQTVIPEGFPITKCPPSRKGVPTKTVSRPRKAGKIISWEVAEALAPDAKLSYDEQVAREPKVIRRMGIADVLEEELQQATE